MRTRAVRLRTAIVAVALVAVAGGCGGDQPPPEPEPDPGTRYERIPEDLCDQVRVEEVAERFNLNLAPWYERVNNSSAERTHWYERCRFEGLAADGRFATDLAEFGPGGAVAVEVYYELADAEDGYEQIALGTFEHRTGTQPGATITEIDGWWDAGISQEWVREVEPESYRGEDEITTIVVSQLVRHGNLVVEAYLNGTCPAEDADEALALLRDLQQALVDEVTGHLSRTTQ